MEIWNNVFSQFNNDGNRNYTELKQKNIDTGMGLERLACVMQGVDNLFEVDSVRKILNTVCAISGKTYGKVHKDDVAIRVITDHIRGATFMICDGVIPSNEGRGYVLRRILRRACRYGKLLGIDRAFLCELCEVVIGENIGAVMIGTIMLLIPGLELGNALRDLLGSDLLAGSLRIVQVCLVAIMIAFGYAAALLVMGGIFG